MITDHEEIQGSLENISSELEKIREKTFDSEFKELVGRVTSHRAESRDLQLEAEKETLNRYQKLFYRASNLYWRESAYTAFDPFSLDDSDSKEQLALEILTEMDSMGFPHFAILAYDFKKKSFACRINHITQLNRENLVLDTDEQLFRKTLRSRTGIIVYPRDIEKDFNLKKRFTSEKDNAVPGILYLLSLEFLRDSIFGECEADIPQSVPTIPTVLVILIDGKEAINAEDIFSTIREKLSLHLALYKNVLYPNVSDYCTGSIDGALSILDYYYTLYCHVLEGTVIYLRQTTCLTPESSYLFSFFTDKLLSTFPSKAALVSIDAYSSFLFCAPDSGTEITKFATSFCAETGNFFKIRVIDRSTALTLNGLLSEFIKNET